MTPAVTFFGHNDPEPIGAEASLMLFGFFGAITSVTAYHIASKLLHRRCGIYVSLAVGAACSLAFFSPFQLVHLGQGMAVPLCMAFALAPLVAVSSVRFGAAGA